MQVTVRGDSLTAFETVKVFDAAGASAPAPETPKPLLGARVMLRAQREESLLTH